MTDIDRRAFGASFRFGVATSAYQIEGASAEDGRKPSIWDVFSHIPGKVKGAANGDVACDHYHRLEEDLALLDWLAVDAYRFSVSWPRVLPDGRGNPNAKGLDFYDRLVDGLLAKGISPCATLYHWDLPEALEREGGWLSRATTQAFADYACAVADRLGDRVALWLTHNEPWCQAFLGYETGLFAPGHQSFAEALRCAHHLLLSHGLAVQALRTRVQGPIGIALNFLPAYPASEEVTDRNAATRLDGYFNRWFVEPVAGRGYPEDMVARYAQHMPQFPAQDLEVIATPIDVMGINYYERALIRDNPGVGLLELDHVKTTEFPRTADREIYPAGLGDILRRLHREYGFQHLVITENGAAFDDAISAAGGVPDPCRVDFLGAHLHEVLRAIREGIPVEAYYAWSLLDNFEWSQGYSLRYGLVHVDFETQKRTPKQSAHYLRNLCRGEQT